MKKVFGLLLILIMLIPATSYAQKDTGQYVTDSDVERLVDKYGGKVQESFNNFVERATPVAEEGFKIAVRLQFAKGLAWVLGILISVMLLSVYLKEYNRISTILNSGNVPKNMSASYGPWDEDNCTFILIFSGIGFGIMTILSLAFAYSGMTHLIAPEWYAIVEIINLFK